MSSCKHSVIINQNEKGAHEAFSHCNVVRGFCFNEYWNVQHSSSLQGITWKSDTYTEYFSVLVVTICFLISRDEESTIIKYSASKCCNGRQVAPTVTLASKLKRCRCVWVKQWCKWKCRPLNMFVLAILIYKEGKIRLYTQYDRQRLPSLNPRQESWYFRGKDFYNTGRKLFSRILSFTSFCRACAPMNMNSLNQIFIFIFFFRTYGQRGSYNPRIGNFWSLYSGLSIENNDSRLSAVLGNDKVGALKTQEAIYAAFSWYTVPAGIPQANTPTA